MGSILSYPLSTAETAALIVAGLIALATWFFRRRLPLGMAEGALVAAVSGLAVMAFANGPGTSLASGRLGHVFAGLAIIWFAAARVAQKSRSSERTPSASNLFTYAAILAGVLSAALPLHLEVDPGMNEHRLASIRDAALLVILAVLALIAWRRIEAVYCVAALLICILRLSLPKNLLGDSWPPGPRAAFALAVLSLAAIVALEVRRWWLGRRDWLLNPIRVPDVPPTGAIRAFVLATAALAVLGGTAWWESAWSPWTLFLSALSAFIWGHARARLWAGEAGLAITALAVVAAVTNWVVGGWLGGLIGLAVAALYMLWLARFWNQQLHHGQAWTTTGALIPAARRVAFAAIVAAGGLALTRAITSDGFPADRVASNVVAVLLLLLAALRFARDRHPRDAALASHSAWLCLLAAAPSAQALLHAALGFSPPLLLPLLGGGFLLSLWKRLAPRGREASLVDQAYVLGALPTLLAAALTLYGSSAAMIAAMVLCGLAVCVGPPLEWPPRRGARPQAGTSNEV